MEQLRKANPLGIGLLAVLAMVAFFYLATAMFVPLVLSVFVFFLVSPGIDRLETWKIPRALSAPIFVIFIMMAVSGIGVALYGNIAGMVHELPRYSEKIRGIVKKLEAEAALLQRGTEIFMPTQATPDDTQKVQVVSGGGGGDSFSAVVQGVDSAFGVLTNLFLVPILAIFYLLDQKYLKDHFRSALGSGFPLDQVCREISGMVRGYFFGNLVVGLVAAIGFYVVFSILGLDNRVGLALLAGFLNLIPILGALVGAILPAAQALLQFDGLSSVFGILGASVILHLLVNNIVIPKMVGSRINVNATAATLGLVFWGWLWGGVGLLLAIPLTALIRILLSARAETKSWSEVFAENPDVQKTKKSDVPPISIPTGP